MFKSIKSGRRNAGFILLICNLLILLFILSIHLFSFRNTCTFAAAAAAVTFTVYGNSKSLSISWKTNFFLSSASSLSLSSIDSCSVFVVWFELPVNTLRRRFDADGLFLMSSPYCNSSLESCLAVWKQYYLYPNTEYYALYFDILEIYHHTSMDL